MTKGTQAIHMSKARAGNLSRRAHGGKTQDHFDGHDDDGGRRCHLFRYPVVDGHQTIGKDIDTGPDNDEMIPPTKPNATSLILSARLKFMISSNTCLLERRFSSHSMIPKLSHSDTKNSLAITVTPAGNFIGTEH